MFQRMKMTTYCGDIVKFATFSVWLISVWVLSRTHVGSLMELWPAESHSIGSADGPTHQRANSTVIPESCTGPISRPPELAVADIPRDSWQESQGNASYVFSAFADLRCREKRLSILGVNTKGRDTDEVRCRLWMKHDPRPLVVAAIYQGRPQFRFTCRLRPGELPYAVSLIHEHCEEALNIMYVHYAPSTIERGDAYNFTICVSPMFGNYDNVAELVEMIEVNTMFGANKIVLYNYSTGPSVQPYIKSYELDGIVDTYEWDIPENVLISPNGYYGQLIALNDCVYRYMYRTKFAVVVDLDEIIVPRLHSSWMEMLEQFLDHAPGHPLIHGSLVFRCVFFRKEMIDQFMAKNSTIRELGLRTLLNTMREGVWPPMRRSKYITIPELVDVANIHSVYSFVSTAQELKNHAVEPSHALLHHYRLWEDPPSGPPPVEKDTFMHTYREAIVNRVISRHNVVKNGSPKDSYE